MIEVVLHQPDLNEVLDIVNDLRKQGYVQGVDFDFKYNSPLFGKSEDTYLSYDELLEKRNTIFYFYSEELATYFELRWK